jgi:hypothetical protein
MKYFFEKRSLKNPKLEPIRIYFNIRDNAIGEQWLHAHFNLLYKDNPIIPKAHPMDKLDNYTTNMKFLCERFNHGTKQINKHIIGYEHIDIQLDPTNITQDKLNQAHHHFEKLIGQKWDVGLWFEDASNAGKWAIMELNSSIHNIELNQKDWQVYGHGYNCRDWVNNTWPIHNQIENLETNPIDNDSYKCYQKSQPWGSMILFYQQTGKPHYDAFEDNDEYVDKNNISGWKYVTGESMFSFMWMPDNLPEYEQWLVKNNYNLNDITECYYGLSVADIDREYIMPRYGNNEKEVHNVMIQYDDITKVGLANNKYQERCSRDYSWYTWEDQYKADKEKFL